MSLGAAVTFAVAAVSGVAGNRLTGRVTPALLVFAGLVVAGMLVSYWVDRSTRTNAPAEGESSDHAARASRLSDLRGARQDIIASGPGSVAQGALGGDVINYGEAPRPSVPGPTDAASEERDGQS